jgi:hypothetical protein
VSLKDLAPSLEETAEELVQMAGRSSGHTCNISDSYSEMDPTSNEQIGMPLTTTVLPSLSAPAPPPPPPPAEVPPPSPDHDNYNDEDDTPNAPTLSHPLSRESSKSNTPRVSNYSPNGFEDVRSILQYALVLFDGECQPIGEKKSMLTWLEELVILLEIVCVWENCL